MRYLNLGNSAETLRIEFPLEWDPSALTGLTLAINNRDGSELAAAAAVTLWTATTLDGAVAVTATSCTLADGSDELFPGDGIMFSGAGGTERKVVKGYDASTELLEVDSIFERDFSDGDDVYGLFGTIEVDLSNLTTFPAGQKLMLIWSPTGTGGDITELAEIATYMQVDIAGLGEQIRDVWPRAYKGLTVPRDRLKRVARRARNDIRKQLLAINPRFEINLVRDQSVLIEAIAAQCAVIWTLGGDEKLKDERAAAREQVAIEVETLSKLNIWADTDGDGVEDAGETKAHPTTFHIGW